MNALQVFDDLHGGLMAGLQALAARRAEQAAAQEELASYNALVDAYNDLDWRYERLMRAYTQMNQSQTERNDALFRDWVVVTMKYKRLLSDQTGNP